MAGETHNPLNGPRGSLKDSDAGVGAQVERWRAQRMSWSAIARSLGRSEPDTRAMYDPDWKGKGAR